MKKIIGAVMLLVSGSASAVPVLWTLDGVTLREGLTPSFAETYGSDYYEEASLTGSFIYDADTNTYSDINLVAEQGYQGWWAEYTYTDDHDILDKSSTGLTLYTGPPPSAPCGFDFCDRTLYLNFLAPLTNAGGTVTIDTYPASYEYFYTYGGGVGFEREIISGTLTGTVVPVPAAVWLFASGLGLLGWLRGRAL